MTTTKAIELSQFASTVSVDANNNVEFSGDFAITDKIVHSGDTNTSIRFPANDTVTVETNGAERLRVTSAGNVGIGVTSPTATLHVNGTVAGTFLSTQAQAEAGADNTTVMTPLRTAQAIATQIVLVGQLAFFAQSTAPTGWLKANGALVSRTTYAALFTAIGTTFGAGDGSTNFALPDLRGEFPRGWDDGRGADSGRVFGSAQGDAIRNITGNFSAGKSVSASGAFNVDSVTQSGDGSQQTGGNFSFSADRVVPTAAENRPRNVALLACIKF